MRNTDNFQPMGPARKAPRKSSALNGHRLPTCETGLIRYRSREQASDALTKAKWTRQKAESFGEPTRRREVRSFSCPRCQGHHLTAEPLRETAGAR